MKMKYLIIVFTLITFQNTFTQQSQISKAVNHISSYIASEEFLQLKNKIGDVSAVDSIFIDATKYTEGNISDALLALMLATVPYNEVPIQIPLFNSTIYYPLTSAEEKIFLAKNENLPKYLFFDTPQIIMETKINLHIFLEVLFYHTNPTSLT